METIYVAGGCLWGVQHFFKSLPGVLATEAGRANGSSDTLEGPYDGYAECVKVDFDEKVCSVGRLMDYLFEIIDPYSINKQGNDVGLKYRTGIYSTEEKHLEAARSYIEFRTDRNKIALEVKPLTNYVRSAEEHQDHLERFPEDYYLCHIPLKTMNKYRQLAEYKEKNQFLGEILADSRAERIFADTYEKTFVSRYDFEARKRELYKKGVEEYCVVWRYDPEPGGYGDEFTYIFDMTEFMKVENAKNLTDEDLLALVAEEGKRIERENSK